MSSLPFTSGLILGIAGSLHCMGMCGPLLMALPFESEKRSLKFLRLFLYHAGRMSAYLLLGLIGGLAGHSVSLAGWQQALSIVLGSIVLFLFVRQVLFSKHTGYGWFYQVYARVQRLFAKHLQHPGTGSFAILGFLNGWLPCGMAYIALAAAVSFGNISASAATMIGFGLGTLPALLLVNFGARLIKPELRPYFRKAIPVMMAITGILLILRGLNLGIPYISPELLAENGKDTIICH